MSDTYHEIALDDDLATAIYDLVYCVAREELGMSRDGAARAHSALRYACARR